MSIFANNEDLILTIAKTLTSGEEQETTDMFDDDNIRVRVNVGEGSAVMLRSATGFGPLIPMVQY